MKIQPANNCLKPAFSAELIFNEDICDVIRPELPKKGKKYYKYREVYCILADQGYLTKPEIDLFTEQAKAIGNSSDKIQVKVGPLLGYSDSGTCHKVHYRVDIISNIGSRENHITYTAMATINDSYKVHGNYYNKLTSISKFFTLPQLLKKGLKKVQKKAKLKK